MGKLAGIKLEKDALGRMTKVTLDMKFHAQFVKNYLDHLTIAKANKNATFVAWENLKAELDKKHKSNQFKF